MPLFHRSTRLRRRRPRPLGHVYVQHFTGDRRERQFLASISFFLSFGIVRIITHAIRRRAGPFRNV